MERQLTWYIPDGDTYVFRYNSGGERDVVEAGIDLARNPESGFTNYDARLLNLFLSSR